MAQSNLFIMSTVTIQSLPLWRFNKLSVTIEIEYSHGQSSSNNFLIDWRTLNIVQRGFHLCPHGQINT